MITLAAVVLCLVFWPVTLVVLLVYTAVVCWPITLIILLLIGFFTLLGKAAA